MYKSVLAIRCTGAGTGRSWLDVTISVVVRRSVPSTPSPGNTTQTSHTQPDVWYVKVVVNFSAHYVFTALTRREGLGTWVKKILRFFV